MFIAIVGSTRAAEPLIKLSTPGPWPGVSHLIAFNGRVWFANSKPYENFNAADIYSYAPGTSDVRYERGLPTQDTGKPVNVGGQLLWPFEDPRSNLALGEYAVTDGANWSWNVFSQGRALHVHAMADCGGNLVAGTGGWVGALQASADNGHSWDEVYRYPTPEDQLSRITDVINFRGQCYLAVTAKKLPGPKLIGWASGQVYPLFGWPEGTDVTSLTTFRGALYGVNADPSGQQIWRFNGTTSEQVNAPPNGFLRHIAATEKRLLAITNRSDGGDLWESPDGSNWTKIQSFEGTTPIDVLGVGPDIYIGTYDRDGQGELWGYRNPVTLRPGGEATALIPANVSPIADSTLGATVLALEAALALKEEYAGYRREMLSVALSIAQTRDPKVGIYYSSILTNDFSSHLIPTFTGASYQSHVLIRWLLMHLISLNGNGYIPATWLNIPWTVPARRSEKYFESELAAITTVGWIGQNNRETISALLGNLSRREDPLWFQGHVIAALNALTGLRFAYDVDAWQAWWSQAKENWPE